MNSDVRAIPFVKASACGNDFLLIDLATAPAEIDIHTFTKLICDRHDGIGADGVEWMLPHATADTEIRLINADGSEAEISGNGTRCVAAHVCAERGKERITIQTGAGLKTCELSSHSGSQYEFEVEMGEAVVEKELEIEAGGTKVGGVPVSMGNPHFVIFVKELAADWQRQAGEIQRNAHFTQGVNVEFVKVEGKHDIHVRFFERGVGETQSSGTGSCASAAAAMAAEYAESPVKVHAPGGTQVVRREQGKILLRGAARIVCRGGYLLG